MRRELLWLLIATLVLALGAWLYVSLERYETKIYKSESREAFKNPFLAAQRYLEKRGVDIQAEQERLDFEIISHDEIVFLSRADALLVSESQIEKAVAWVKKGGFLILGVEDEVEGHSSILKHYNIEVDKESIDLQDILVDRDGERLTEEERAQEIERRLNNPSDSDESSEDGRLVAQDDTTRAVLRLLNLEFDHRFFPMELKDIDDTLYIAVLDRVVLDHSEFYDSDEDYQSGYDQADSDANLTMDYDKEFDYQVAGEISDDYGTRLLQIKDELGTVTALSSTKLWRNKNIGLGDHARLLSYFVPDNSNVHFFYDVQAPTLTELANQYLKETVIGVLLFVFFWLWRIATRVLKQREIDPRLGRDFGEHLKAGAKFIAKHEQYQPILTSINEDIELQMRRYHFGFASLVNADKTKLLNKQTGLDPAIFTRWYAMCENVKNEYDFVQALKLGQTIRNKL